MQLEKLANLELDASKISDGQIITFSKDTTKENSSTVNLVLKEKTLHYLINNTKDNQSVEIVLALNPLEIIRDKNIKYYPLIAIAIQTSTEDILAVPLSLKPTNEENKEEIVYPKLSFEFHTFGDYAVSVSALKEYLGIEPDSLPINLPLATFIKDISSSSKEWFPDILNDFKNWSNDSIIGNRSYRRVSNKSGFILSNYKISSNPNLSEQLNILGKEKYFPKPSSAAHEYLYGKGIKNISKYNTLTDLQWLGSFHQYPIAKGQAVVCQKFQDKNSVIACQGAPGTGKTTLLMAIIANSITSRALSLINGTDKNNLTLIVSTANKAVQNAARELQGTKEFNTNNSFYFIGGNSENQKIAFARVEQYKSWLSEQLYDEALHQKLKDQIKFLTLCFESRFNLMQSKAKLLQEAISELDNYNTTNPDIISHSSIVFENFTEQQNLLSQYDINTNNALSEQIKYQEYLSIKNQNSNISNLSNEELLSIRRDLSKSFIDDMTQVFVAIESVNFLIDLLTSKKKKLSVDFASKNKEWLLKFGFDWMEIKHKTFKDTLSIIEKMTNDSQSLYQLNVSSFFIDGENPIEKIKDFLATFEDKKLYDGKLSELTILETTLFSAKEAYRKYENFGELHRTKAVRTNRKLYTLSKQLLEQEGIKNKSDLTNALSLWYEASTSFGLKQKVATDAIRNIGVKRYYELISLAYPIHTSSIDASINLFRPFFRDGFDALRGFKPINLLFSDESGMSLVHKAYPVIFQSEQVIAVGDPKQLPPVVPIDQNTGIHFENEYYSCEEDKGLYSPFRSSLYHRAAKCESGHYSDIGDGVILDEHRRCQKDIANLFVDIASYDGVLVKTSQLPQDRQERLNKIGGKNLLFYDVAGMDGKLKNTNIDEMYAIKNIINKLQDCGYDIKSEIGIITPFASQESLLIEHLGEVLGHSNGNAKIGTIHKFQGVEFNVILFSPVIFKDTHSTNFLNSSPNLLNVAISRAKDLFVVVGNANKIKAAGGGLGKLYTHCFNLGYIYQLEHQYDTREPAKVDFSDELLNPTILNECEHIDWIIDTLNNAKESIVITSPWILKNTVEEFIVSHIQNAISRGVKVKIYYGYTKTDFGEQEAISLLENIGCTLILHPQSTHSKIVIVDEEIVCIGSFNWLSQKHYRNCSNKNLSKLRIRNETSIYIKSKSHAKEMLETMEQKDTNFSSNSSNNNDSINCCTKCGCLVDDNVMRFSLSRFGKALCRKCQIR